MKHDNISFIQLPEQASYVAIQVSIKLGHLFHLDNIWLPRLYQSCVSTLFEDAKINADSNVGSEYIDFVNLFPLSDLSQVDQFFNIIFNPKISEKQFELTKKAVEPETLSLNYYKKILQFVGNSKSLKDIKLSDIENFSNSIACENVRIFIGLDQFHMQDAEKIVSRVPDLKSSHNVDSSPSYQSLLTALPNINCISDNSMDGLFDLLLLWPAYGCQDGATQVVYQNSLTSLLNRDGNLFDQLAGLVKDFYIGSSVYTDFGLIGFSTRTSAEDADEVIEIVRQYLEKEITLSNKDLKTEQTAVIKNNKKRWDSNQGYFEWIVNSLLYYNQIINVDKSNQLTRKTSIKNLKKFAKEIFSKQPITFLIGNFLK